MTTQIELTQSGVGDIEIMNLDAQALDTLISGLGDISVDGQVNDQIIALISAGNYQAENLVSATVDVEIGASGSATVRVDTTLNADIKGTGSVFYHGSPVVNRDGQRNRRNHPAFTVRPSRRILAVVGHDSIHLIF